MQAQKTDYEQLLHSADYQGQIQLMFDKNGEQTWIIGQKEQMLTWNHGQHGLCYYPDERY